MSTEEIRSEITGEQKQLRGGGSKGEAMVGSGCARSFNEVPLDKYLSCKPLYLGVCTCHRHVYPSMHVPMWTALITMGLPWRRHIHIGIFFPVPAP